MNRGCKKAISALAVLTLIFYWSHCGLALTIGTFNMEYFDMEGENAYSPGDCRHLANTILSSDADLLALQEVEGDRTMARFIESYLPGWEFSGNDTPGKQDLFFLWKQGKIIPVTPLEVLFEEDRINWEGEMVPLFQRPPLKGVFRDEKTGFFFTVINVHLRSLGTKGAKDRLRALAMNNGIRQAQVLRLNGIMEAEKSPIFIMGDFNSVEIPGALFPVFPLTEGYSYDDVPCTIDHIGYLNVLPDGSWRIRDVETSIPQRAKKGRQHPDHDIVVLSITPSVPVIP